ncbi:uncharacterized protein BDR25DRAFT_305252 [Lindgomyces ingoldianus]|uniref:Uncharacterized protein n=1 Tax=Lindgomyces ingoldianus TaxID=673940 RepID=A0ACB6QP28_9PLEO|nr:uncharacterized protein BDR25DRAFT_305252 [Lindgomyces ingoldianus]KAF2468280.1 hypothetical protein BDR25DRAFT_305252 [Lindgomyces ingoldianus]
MSSIGPSLPPHLAKRKRDGEYDSRESPQRSSSSISSEKRRRVLGPAAPPSKPSPPRILGPTLPPSSTRSCSGSSSSDSEVGPAPLTTPKTTYGPTAPPAPLSERPLNSPSDDSDSSDDEFGPAPPPAGASHATYPDDENRLTASAFDTDPKYAEQAKKVQRDEWMTMPPTQDDLAARIDPTKLRARKFNTGKGPRGGSSSGRDMGVWTETPEQKLKRLQNEALGVSAPANSSNDGHESRRTREEERKARKIKEKLDGLRGKSLMEEHKEKGVGKDKEDDPSKRAFDREKDMGVGMKISHKQRQEMLRKSKGFGDRFSGGGFL